jgi:L-2,4-diaminobutyrate transaminase
VGSVAARVADACLQRGVVTRALPQADTIAFSPPFVIAEDEVETIVAVAREAVDAVAAAHAKGD